ncbi:MAG TPA: adenylate/guanylate cyclase domain-containing protein [Actinomycetota bacterium]|nr:adenylate/guanylate cyclase domain-containing protein [Actinomycetota bacterium]
MVADPRSTICLLFTDIENSTELWEKNASLMQDALSDHISRVEEVVSDAGGRVVKHTGDGTFSTFPNVDSGLAAATAIQLHASRSTGGLRPQVRVGVHVGAGDMSADDHFGPHVNLCARITDAAYGGQVLVSADAAEAASSTNDRDLVDLGLSRLRGISRAQRLYQLVASGLRRSFPPLVSLESIPTNLPRGPALIGRDAELAELRDALQGEPVAVTITGPGGVGKTSLAIRAARHLVDGYPDGVWFVDLARIEQGAFIASTVAEVLRLSEFGSGAPEVAVMSFLHRRTVLLVIDNCEHVIDGAAAFIEQVMTLAPEVRVLCTSREPLGIPGEVLLRLEPLPVPQGVDVSVHQLLHYPGTKLFLDRGRDVRRDFRANDENASAIASICRSLDGMPLALEIAAAQLRSLPLHELSSRLDARFGSFQGLARGASKRQRTLDATLSWSYDQLDDGIKRILRTVASFSGGFSLEMAEHVCGLAGIAPPVIAPIADLVDKSMITLTSDEHRPYRLLETVKMFCRARSVELGELEELQDAHLAWAYQHAQRTHERWPDVADSAEAMDEMERTQPEYRSALAFSVESGKLLRGLELADRLPAYWSQRSPGDVRHWYPLLLQPGVDAPDDLMCLSLIKLGREIVGTDVESSVSALERALEIARKSVPRLVALCLHYLARAYWQQDRDPSRAMPMFEEAISLAPPQRPGTACFDLVFLALAYSAQGKIDDALRVAERAVEVGVGPLRHPSHAREALAVALCLKGEAASAAAEIAYSLPVYMKLKMSACLAHGFDGAAAVLLAAGDTDGAAKSLSFSDAARASIGAVPLAWEEFISRPVRARVGHRMPDLQPDDFDPEEAGKEATAALIRVSGVRRSLEG